MNPMFTSILLAAGVLILTLLIIVVHRRLARKNEEIILRDELFAELINGVDDIFLMIDNDSQKVVYVSPNIEKILGVSQKDAYNDISNIENASTENDTLGLMDLAKIVRADERIEWYGEYRHCLSGELLWFRISALCKQINGKSEYIVVMSERTQERIDNLVLMDEVTSAERANKAKSLFLSNMSHDIRTPLNAILGYTTIASKCVDKKEKVSEYLAKIHSSGNLLLRLVNDILDMSSIESGKFTLNESVVDLSEVLHGIKTITFGEIGDKNLTFDIDISGIKHEQVLCDRMRLEQLLLNLLTNSVKFTRENGKITIVINEYGTADNGISDYEIKVSDNGIGMSAEFVKKMFEPFERERTSTDSRTQGTGLGLTISKSIIDMAGGTIEVRSEQDEGSEFEIHLPFRIIDNGQINNVISEFDGTVAVLCQGTSKRNINSALSKLVLQYVCVDTLDELEKLIKGKSYRTKPRIIAVIDEDEIKDKQKIVNILDNKDVSVIIIGSDTTKLSDCNLSDKLIGICEKPVLTSEIRDALICIIENSEEKLSDEKNCYGILSGKKILIVDDSNINCEIVEIMLKPYNITVDKAEDGSKAIEAIKSSEPCYDLVLMDIEMPVMDGFECTRKIREMGFDRDKLPIIALTANVFSEDLISTVKNGMNEYMTKPFDINNLLAVLYKFLNK